MKKIVFLIMVFGLLGMVGCGKDDGGEIGVAGVTPAQSNTPKVYTFVYDDNLVPEDTARAYLNVDTFYVVPITTNSFSTMPQNIIHVICNNLENAKNINPKTRGKGDFITIYASVEDSAWLSQFGYNVKREYSKSR